MRWNLGVANLRNCKLGDLDDLDTLQNCLNVHVDGKNVKSLDLEVSTEAKPGRGLLLWLFLLEESLRPYYQEGAPWEMMEMRSYQPRGYIHNGRSSPNFEVFWSIWSRLVTVN